MKSCLFRKFTPASSSIGCSLTLRRRRCFAIVIRWICISIRARDSPMHFRGPAENGIIVIGCRVRNSSGPKRSGLKRSGASQKAGCRWIKYGEM